MSLVRSIIRTENRTMSTSYVYKYFVVKTLFLNALILTKYVIREEVERHFNLSSEVLNDDIGT